MPILSTSCTYDAEIYSSFFDKSLLMAIVLTWIKTYEVSFVMPRIYERDGKRRAINQSKTFASLYHNSKFSIAFT